MSLYYRAYIHGAIMVLVGCVIAFLLVLTQQYKFARSMVIVAPFLGSLVTALVAPGRRFLVGIALLPAIGVAMFTLTFAWYSVAPLPDGEGIAEVVHDFRRITPDWAGACFAGAALGWAVEWRRGAHPVYIRVIAGVHGAASVLAVWYVWPNMNLPDLPELSDMVVTMGLALLPGLLGLLLMLGKRWVRWLFVALIPLVAAEAVIAMLGNAMQGAPKDSPETAWLWCFFLVTLASTVAVHRYFDGEYRRADREE